jgi:hypothetical protein
MYIGYSTLEKLLARTASAPTLYLILLDETIPGADGIDLLRCELMVQVPVANGAESQVFYWRMFIGQIIAPGGKPFAQELEKIKARGKSAFAAIRQYLAAQPKVQRIEEGAVIAMPRHLKLLLGHADCLAFDQASDTFHLKGTGKCSGNGRAERNGREVQR